MSNWTQLQAALPAVKCGRSPLGLVIGAAPGPSCRREGRGRDESLGAAAWQEVRPVQAEPHCAARSQVGWLHRDRAGWTAQASEHGQCSVLLPTPLPATIHGHSGPSGMKSASTLRHYLNYVRGPLHRGSLLWVPPNTQAPHWVRPSFNLGFTPGSCATLGTPANPRSRVYAGRG